MKITWWEWEQLREHVEEREDLYMQSGQHIIRMDTTDPDSPKPGYGFAVKVPGTSSKYRMCEVQVVTLGWTAELTASMFEDLLEHWTSYGTRLKVQQLLEGELKLEPAIAELMAIAIEYVEQIGDTHESVPPQEIIWPESKPIQDVVKTFLLVGGGYVSLRLVGGLIRARLSVPSDKKYGAGFGPTLDGFVRSLDGKNEQAFAFITGAMITNGETEDLGEPIQLELPLEDEDE